MNPTDRDEDTFIKLKEVSHPSSGWIRKTDGKGFRTGGVESNTLLSKVRSGSDLRGLKLYKSIIVQGWQCLDIMASRHGKLGNLGSVEVIGR